MFFVAVAVRESPGRGDGVFAEETIQLGQSIFRMDGPYVTWDEAVALGRENHVMPISPTRYANMSLENTLNHSCDPNIGYADALTGIALRDVRVGEELTWDYSMLTVDGWSMHCACGTAACRGTISNFVDLPSAIQERYRSVTPQWVLAYAATQMP